MAVGRSSVGKDKLAKVALAKANTIQVEVTGIAGETVTRVNNMATSLGIGFDANNNITTNTVNDRLDVLEGATATNVVVLTIGTYYVVYTDKAVLASGGTVVNLPIPLAGYAISIKKITGTQSVIINPYALETIDGETELSIIEQYESITLISDGTNWYII